MEYFENIKRLRREQGMTQQELADAVGATRLSVVRWEGGWNVPKLYFAEKMARLFGVSVEELMNGEKGDAEEETSTQKTENVMGLSIFFCALTFLPAHLPARLFHSRLGSGAHIHKGAVPRDGREQFARIFRRSAAD